MEWETEKALPAVGRGAGMAAVVRGGPEMTEDQEAPWGATPEGMAVVRAAVMVALEKVEVARAAAFL